MFFRSYEIKKYLKKLFLVMVVGSGVLVRPASAIELMKSVPQDGLPLSLHNPIITLYFSEKFNPFKSRLELIEAKGPPRLLTVVPSDDYTALRTKLKLPAGHYTVRWRVQTWSEEKAEGSYNVVLVP